MGIKFSDLPSPSLPYLGSELIPMVQSGVTKIGSLSSVATLLSSVLLSETALAQLSSSWQSTYTTTRSNSANWSNSYTTTQSNSGNWTNGYTTTQANSAIWSNSYTTTQANSARWTSVYSTVCALSAAWEESADILPTVTNYLSSNNVLLSSVTVTDYINDGSNLIAIEPNNRRLITSTGSILLDWSNAGGYGAEFSNGASLETNALFFADGSSNYYSIQESTLKDASNVVGVDWSSRQLIANDGTTQMLDWSNSAAGIAVAEGVPLNVDILYDAGAPLNYIDIVNGEIGGYSGTNVPSIDWTNRELVGDDGTTVSVDWSNGLALGSFGMTLASNSNITAPFAAVPWGISPDGVIADYNTSDPSIDLMERHLKAYDGSLNIDWSTAAQIKFGSTAATWYLDTPGATSGNLTLDITDGNLILNQPIKDTSALSSIDTNTRRLIASDGSTIAADWSTGTPAFAQGATFIPTAVASLVGAEGTMAYVNDADTPVIGSAVVGGGSAKCLVCYNGTSWIVTSLL